MVRVKFWHVALGLIVLLSLISYFGGFNYKGPHIARVEVSDLILDDIYRHEMLVQLRDDDDVNALIVRINSPGGSASASQEIYNDLRSIAVKKPVIAVISSVAASGGYVVALGADRIFANSTSITGSVGVLFQWANIKGLADKIGIVVYTIRSGSLKAKPDPFEAPSLKTKKYLQKLISETFDWFIDLVARRRQLTKNDLLRKIGDGRIVTGATALRLNLIDEIGAEPEARKWLSANHKIDLELPVENYKPNYPNEGLRDFLVSAGLKAAGFPAAKTNATKASGLMLLWKF